MSKLLAPRRIGVCGSSKRLPTGAAEFCEAIGRRLADERSVQIVTGGTKSRKSALPGDYGTDWLVASAAAKAVGPDAVASRIVTVTKDEVDSGRFVMGTHERSNGRTGEARRIAFVRRVDALIAIAGGGGTEQELALAWEFKHRILPVPAFRGAARDFWNAYRDDVMAALRIDEATARRWEAAKDRQASALVDEMIAALMRSLSRRCFVIMPFDSALTELYDRVIAPAVEACGDHVIRMDRLGVAGDAATHLREGIRYCDYVIAVLDKLKPNVMYELGLAHALDKPSILLRPASDDTPPPFDIYTHQRIDYSDVGVALQTQLQGRIRALFSADQSARLVMEA